MAAGPFVTLCVSCLALLVTSLIAFGAILGLGTLRFTSTPLDPVLDILEIPLFLAFTAVFPWVLWRGPRHAFVAYMVGALLALGGLLVMPHPSDNHGGDHGSSSALGSDALVGPVPLFSIGVALVGPRPRLLASLATGFRL